MEVSLTIRESKKAIEDRCGVECPPVYTLRRVFKKLQREGKLPLQTIAGAIAIGEADIEQVIEELKATGRLAVKC